MDTFEDKDQILYKNLNSLSNQSDYLELVQYKINEFVGYKWANVSCLDLTLKRDDKLDWSGLYTCLDLKTAEGYLTDYLPKDFQGNGIVYMHKMYLKKDLKVFRCNDCSFKDGSHKANNSLHKIKESLKYNFNIIINDEDKFLPKLGELGLFHNEGYAFQCYHDTDGTEEIVIPNDLKEDYYTSVLYKKYKFLNFQI